MNSSGRAAVLIDLDDTLFDHAHSSRSALSALHAEFAELSRIPFETMVTVYAHNLEQVHALVLAGELTPEEARLVRLRRVLRDCGAPPLDPEPLAIAYRAAYQRARQPVLGGRELLLALRPHAKVAIVTNNIHKEQVDKLAHLEMTHLIDELVTSEEVGSQKPDAAIFRAALARLGATAGQAVMLGDSWGADILGARSAGIWPIWLNRTARPCPAPTLCDQLTTLVPTASVVELLLARR